MKLLSDEKVISALTQAFQDKPAGGLMPEEFRAVIADAEEDIVRCGNCKCWNDYYRECESPNWNTGTDEYIVQPAGMFCGWGERRTDGRSD